MRNSKTEAFYHWFYEVENFGFRAERFLDDLGGNEELYDKMLPWLKAAYQVGKTTQEQQ